MKAWIVRFVVLAMLGALVIYFMGEPQRHRKRADRVAGKAALLKAMQLQERFLKEKQLYADQTQLAAAIGISSGTTIYSGENPGAAAGSNYTIAVELSADRRSFTLTASPLPPFTDSECGTFTLTSNSVRSWATAPDNDKACRW